ncbi:hypothetical protein [Peribacillus frigoritolerans]|uniref:hypothetical protein n=1 Tax=Peribacillus frigoritolerans TaxID=450367 RepID=UPI00381450CF
MAKRYIELEGLDRSLIDRDKWPQVLSENLSDSHRSTFFKRKKAVDLYFDGDISVTEICLKTDIKKQQLIKLVKNCLEVDQTGEIYGYRALIPYKRIKPYKRNKSIDGFNDEGGERRLMGAFSMLLEKYPSIEDMIKNYYLNRKKRDITEPITRVKYLHRKFITLCKSEGLNSVKGDYPFNTKDLGLRSLYRYVQELENKYANESVKRYGEDAATLIQSTGIGEQNNIIERPFKRVEFDGHKIDAIFAIEYETIEGDIIVDTLHRIWILTIIDTATRVILGYSLCLKQEYSAQDVLKCIRNAILPWKQKEFTISGLSYPKEGGFHSDIIPLTGYAVWEEIAFDNAKANLALKVKDKLKRTIGCSVNTGPVGTPTRRPIIEKLFDLLEENGFHRLPNTTGSNIKDPRRKNPEKVAIEYRMTVNEIQQIIEVLIAGRNGTPQLGTNYMSPLEVMQQRIIERKMEPRILPKEYRDDVKYLTLTYEVTVRGNLKNGRRPFVYFMGVEYRNDMLANSWHLVKTKIKILVNTEDLRYLKAFLANGEEIGTLRAKGKWSLKPHSLDIRKQINKLRSNGLIHFTQQDDPIEIYFTHLREKAKNSKKARNALLVLDNEQSNNDKAELTLIEDKVDAVFNKNVDITTDPDSDKRSFGEANEPANTVIPLRKHKKSVNHQNRRTFNY